MAYDAARLARDVDALTEATERVAVAPENEADEALKRALSLQDAFKERYPVDVVGMPPVGIVFLLPEGQIKTTLFGSFDAGFDWSAALPLLSELEKLAQEAQEWWPRPDDGQEVDGDRSFVERLVQGVLRPVARAGRVEAERRPHSTAAFNLTTWVLKAITEEARRHHGGPAAAPSAIYAARLAQVKHESVLARARLAQAMQRSAQTRYWYGALLGFAGLAVLCAGLGLAFGLAGTPAFYGVAVPAGGLGAMVSLLQRMSSGRLKLDTTASRDLLVLFGGVRPLIGATFGIVVAAAILAGLLPAIEVPDGQELAFFTVIGFLAGFNERWAQDMLKSSGNSLQPAAHADGEAGPAPAPGLSAAD